MFVWNIDRAEREALPLMQSNGLKPPVPDDVSELCLVHDAARPRPDLAIADRPADASEESLDEIGIARIEREMATGVDQTSISCHQADRVGHLSRPGRNGWTSSSDAVRPAGAPHPRRDVLRHSRIGRGGQPSGPALRYAPKMRVANVSRQSSD